MDREQGKRMTRQDTRKSKRLSQVLRHQPDLIGITLDEGGWTSVPALLEALARFGEPLSRAELEGIVAASDKQRFAFNTEGSLIRANQGHSVRVDLGLAPAVPPDRLYHGTVRQFLASIERDGLLKMSRHHVHLHTTIDVALAVGARRGKPVVLIVDAAAMHRQGQAFYVSENDVWLTDTVPPEYLAVLADPHAAGGA